MRNKRRVKKMKQTYKCAHCGIELIADYWNKREVIAKGEKKGLIHYTERKECHDYESYFWFVKPFQILVSSNAAWEQTTNKNKREQKWQSQPFHTIAIHANFLERTKVKTFMSARPGPTSLLAMAMRITKTNQWTWIFCDPFPNQRATIGRMSHES